MKLAPIVLFVYNRPEHTRKTVEALVKNELASESTLYVFADGPKYNTTPEQIANVEAVREYIHSITGFKEVVIEESPRNKGLANSVIAGVTKVINEWGKVIVVEDDIVTHLFFLRYMNDCLEVYKDRQDIYMIGGYEYNIKFPKSYKDDIYVVHRSCSWGWATWGERWCNADWGVADYHLMEHNEKLRKQFNRGGEDMFPMLRAQIEGRIDSWAIRWDYSMYKHDAVCVHPVQTLCCNIGMDGSGVHCGKVNSDYTAPLYNKEYYNFCLSPLIKVNPKIEQEFAYFQQTGGLHAPTEFARMKGMLHKICKHIWHRYERIMHRPHIPYGSILMLHRVDKPDKNGVWYNEHLKMSPEVIEDMAAYARKRGCKFVSLDEITRKRHFWEQPRRLIAVTLDDGYRDNYVNAAPVLKRLNIPYCIYVCTKMVEGKMLYWWEILEQLIVREREIAIILPDGKEKLFDCSTREKKEQSFLDIREVILKLPQDKLLEQLKVLFSKYEIDYDLGNDSLGLTWEQIVGLTMETLCTIGNHTYSHLAFAGCSDDDIKKDIERAGEEMMTRAGYRMQHFAFPFGESAAVSQHDVELVKNLGFKTSATTNCDFVRYGTDKLELPRLFVTEKNWREVIDRIADNC